MGDPPRRRLDPFSLASLSVTVTPSRTHPRMHCTMQEGKEEKSTVGQQQGVAMSKTCAELPPTIAATEDNRR